MNVPFPAPCRVSAARVGNQSVWGLRIIAELNYYSAIVLQHRQQQKVVGRPRVELGFAPSDDAVFIRYTTRPRGTRAGNPTRISSLGPKRHHALDHASKNWKGCRELNSDLKVRSLAPSIRWTTSPIVGRRCRTRTDIQSLEGSVLILLNEAPSFKTVGAGCRNRTCFVSLKRRVHIPICQSRKIWWVTLESNQPGLA
jgi:hypothetical protein